MVTESVTASSRSSSSDLGYVVALAAVFLVLHVSRVLYAAIDAAPHPGIRPACYVLLLTIVCFWLQKSAARNSMELPFDIGFFLFFAWWVVAPLYLFKIRGVRGMWALLVFAGTYLAAYVFSLILFYAIV